MRLTDLFRFPLGLLLLVPELLQLRGVHVLRVEVVHLVVLRDRLLVQPQVHRDGDIGRARVEPVRAQHVLQAQQVHVGAQRHLAHAVRVEVELVLDYLGEVLRLEGQRLYRAGRKSGP